MSKKLKDSEHEKNGTNSCPALTKASTVKDLSVAMFRIGAFVSIEILKPPVKLGDSIVKYVQHTGA